MSSPVLLLFCSSRLYVCNAICDSSAREGEGWRQTGWAGVPRAVEKDLEWGQRHHWARIVVRGTNSSSLVVSEKINNLHLVWSHWCFSLLQAAIKAGLSDSEIKEALALYNSEEIKDKLKSSTKEALDYGVRCPSVLLVDSSKRDKIRWCHELNLYCCLSSGVWLPHDSLSCKRKARDVFWIWQIWAHGPLHWWETCTAHH